MDSLTPEGGNFGEISSNMVTHMPEGRVFAEINNNTSSCDRITKCVYSVLGVLSIVCLLLTLAIYSLLPQLRNLHGKILMSASISTLLTTIYLVIVYRTVDAADILKHTDHSHSHAIGGHWKLEISDLGCFVLGYFGLFSSLSMFAWMTVMCFNMIWCLKKVKIGLMNTKEKKYLVYCAVGWVLPLIFVFITLALQIIVGTIDQHSPLNPNIGEDDICFVDNKVPLRQLIFFYLPTLFLLGINIIGFLYCIHHIYMIGSTTQISEQLVGRTICFCLY